MRKSFILLLVISLLAACSHKKEETKPAKKHFSYFELNYRGEWIGGVQFCVDSNKIFFIPHGVPQIEGNKITYGILPDSIFWQIDSAVSEIKNIKSLNPDSTYCYDCPEIGIKIITGEDTTRLYQAGDIADVAWKITEKLEKLAEDSTYNHFKAIHFQMETLFMVIQPPKIISPKN